MQAETHGFTNLISVLMSLAFIGSLTPYTYAHRGQSFDMISRKYVEATLSLSTEFLEDKKVYGEQDSQTIMKQLQSCSGVTCYQNALIKIIYFAERAVQNNDIEMALTSMQLLRTFIEHSYPQTEEVQKLDFIAYSLALEIAEMLPFSTTSQNISSKAR